MAKAKKCDRCGAFYEKNTRFPRTLVSGSTVADGIAFTCANGAVVDYTDLCDDCITKAALFIAGRDIVELED